MYSKLPNVIQLSRQAGQLIALRWKLILGIAVVYGILNIILVRGINGWVNVGELKAEFNQLSSGGWGNLASGFSVFALLVGSSTSGSSDTAGAYQSFLMLITSLALVWTYRQLLAANSPPVRIRDGFYRGMYPLVPVLLILLVIGLQLIPMVVGGFIFSILVSGGIAITALEVVISVIFLLLMIWWSLYLLTPSIFALYIATLPDMTPLRALRSARKLLRFRRHRLMLKLLFLPVALFILLGIIIIPIILVAAPLAQWVFLLLSIAVLPIVHAYIYTLYRELLNE